MLTFLSMLFLSLVTGAQGIFIFLVVFIFLILSNLFYTGTFIFTVSYIFFVLSLMSIFILGLIFLSEVNFNIKVLSLMLILICLMFFFSFNIFYVYFFFELSLFPIMFMILGYGYQIEKINSTFYLFIFTLVCSMPFFFVLFNLDVNFNLIFFDLYFSWELEFLMTLMFMLKFPVYFLHFWLPKAHVEAPTTASMLLAGLLLKLGTGGFYRLISSLNFHFTGYFLFLSFIGMIMGSFMCIFQSDLKALSAFSSINHMSFVLLSLVLMSNFSLFSSLLVMLSHGFISTLMFFFIGEFYHLSSTRLIYYYSGVYSSFIYFCLMITLTWLYNSGVPFSLTFFAEFTSFVVLFTKNLSFIFFSILYFFLTFYYCLFFISLNFMSKKTLNLNINLGLFSGIFLLLNSNIFFFMLLL